MYSTGPASIFSISARTASVSALSVTAEPAPLMYSEAVTGGVIASASSSGRIAYS